MVGMMSVPLLSLVMSPVKAAVLLLPLFVVSDVVGVWLYRQHYSAVNLKILLPAGLMGVLVGWLTASMISDLTIKFIIGLLGVTFCLQTWFKKGQGVLPQGANKLKGYFGVPWLASPVSFHMLVVRHFKFTCCPRNYPRLSLQERPPFCLPSLISQKSCLTKTSVRTARRICGKRQL